MPITASGEIQLIADIEAEFDQTGSTDISLFQARDDAGLTSGEVAMTDFYGLSDSVAPSVTTNAASSVATTSLTANGNVTSDGGASITERGFYFGTNSSYSSNTKYTVSGTTGSYNRSFTGLTANTTYYITAYAINSAGESVGSTLTQTTAYSYSYVSSQHGGDGSRTISFQNVNSVWQTIYSASGTTFDCRNSVVGFTNRFVSSGSFIAVWFNSDFAGCNAITMSSVSKSGTGGTLQIISGDYWQYNGYSGTGTMFWRAS